MIGFTKSLAREVASRGITVNAVAPGLHRHRHDARAERGAACGAAGADPHGALGTPEDIAAAVLFLASPQAGYITGETLHVNGGMYMP